MRTLPLVLALLAPLPAGCSESATVGDSANARFQAWLDGLPEEPPPAYRHEFEFELLLDIGVDGVSEMDMTAHGVVAQPEPGCQRVRLVADFAVHLQEVDVVVACDGEMLYRDGRMVFQGRIEVGDGESAMDSDGAVSLDPELLLRLLRESMRLAQSGVLDDPALQAELSHPLMQQALEFYEQPVEMLVNPAAWTSALRMQRATEFAASGDVVRVGLVSDPELLEAMGGGAGGSQDAAGLEAAFESVSEALFEALGATPTRHVFHGGSGFPLAALAEITVPIPGDARDALGAEELRFRFRMETRDLDLSPTFEYGEFAANEELQALDLDIFLRVTLDELEALGDPGDEDF